MYEIFGIERRFRRLSLSLDFIGSRKPVQCARASKSGMPIKVVILPLLASFS